MLIILLITIINYILMVEAIRKLVSGNRRRFVDTEFSLDLTYIIPNRLIAMSYPSSGFESLYRNSIDKVSLLSFSQQYCK